MLLYFGAVNQHAAAYALYTAGGIATAEFLVVRVSLLIVTAIAGSHGLVTYLLPGAAKFIVAYLTDDTLGRNLATKDLVRGAFWAVLACIFAHEQLAHWIVGIILR